MIIEFPNVCLRWFNSKRGVCGVHDWIPDIANKIYGYNLCDGAVVHNISYWQMTDDRHGLKSLSIHDVKVEKVTSAGLLLTDWHLKGYDFDSHFKEAGLLQEDGNIFAPWQLFDGDFVLSVEPCETLHDKYKVKELLNGTAPISNGRYVGDRYIPDIYGEGWWYQHGGWRAKLSKYADNLKNFVKLGQMELEL